MTFNTIMFYIFSAVIIIFSVLTVTSRKILRAAIFLLFVLVATAGLYFMLNYKFLAAVQLLLYAGGIMVLIIFSVLLTHNIAYKFEPVTIKKHLSGLIAAVGGIIITLFTILQCEFSTSVGVPESTDVKTIGTKLISYSKDGYALPFEVISILLLAVMIGAIVIAKNRKE
ncbi:MAG: NADH-quinone oxidoreductase subunit J [Bacteroidota bacterium]